MNLSWSREAWADYLYWERADRRVRDKINTLIEDIQRHPFTGLEIRFGVSTLERWFYAARNGVTAALRSAGCDDA